MSDIQTFSPLAAEYPRMAAAGYLFTNTTAYAPGSDKVGHIRKEQTLDRLEGRLCNVEYMAHAMDIFDTGASVLPLNREGRRQFDYFVNGRGKAILGLLYVALRRFQRENRRDALRAGLAMLVASEDGIISVRDAVNAMAPDLIQMLDGFDDEREKALTRAAQIEDQRLA
ncbi:MAG: hypothetical protein CL949_13740 [Erythrobacter sp.]|nr:hypothetical protein [Erythrobacter sp.]